MSIHVLVAVADPLLLQTTKKRLVDDMDMTGTYIEDYVRDHTHKPLVSRSVDRSRRAHAHKMLTHLS